MEEIDPVADFFSEGFDDDFLDDVADPLNPFPDEPADAPNPLFASAEPVEPMLQAEPFSSTSDPEQLLPDPVAVDSMSDPLVSDSTDPEIANMETEEPPPASTEDVPPSPPTRPAKQISAPQRSRNGPKRQVKKNPSQSSSPSASPVSVSPRVDSDGEVLRLRQSLSRAKKRISDLQGVNRDLKTQIISLSTELDDILAQQGVKLARRGGNRPSGRRGSHSAGAAGPRNRRRPSARRKQQQQGSGRSSSLNRSRRRGPTSTLQIDNLYKQLDTEKRRNKSLTSKLRRYRGIDEMVARYENQLSEKDLAMSELVAEVKSLRNIQRQQTKRLSRIDGRGSDDALNRMVSQSQAQKAQMKKMRQAGDLQRERMKSMTRRIAQLEAKNTEYQTALKSRGSSIGALKKLSALSEQYREATENITALEKSVGILKRSNEQMKKSLYVEWREKKRLQNRLDQAEKGMNEARLQGNRSIMNDAFRSTPVSPSHATGATPKPITRVAPPPAPAPAASSASASAVVVSSSSTPSREEVKERHTSPSPSPPPSSSLPPPPADPEPEPEMEQQPESLVSSSSSVDSIPAPVPAPPEFDTDAMLDNFEADFLNDGSFLADDDETTVAVTVTETETSHEKNIIEEEEEETEVEEDIGALFGSVDFELDEADVDVVDLPIDSSSSPPSKRGDEVESLFSQEEQIPMEELVEKLPVAADDESNKTTIGGGGGGGGGLSQADLHELEGTDNDEDDVDFSSPF